MTAQSPIRLDEEIARLRERLESAEDMRRAIIAKQVDGFVVGEEPEGIVLLDDGSLAPRSLIDHLPHCIVTVSRDAEILYANRRFGEALDYPLDRLFSTSFSELVTTDSRPAFRRFLAASEPQSSLCIGLIRADGGRIDVRVTTMSVTSDYISFLMDEEPSDDEAAHALAAIASGNIDGVVVGGERVMLLAEAQRPYRALVDRMQEGAATVLKGGEILYANERFASMVGASRDSLLGRPLRAVLGAPAVDAMLMNDEMTPSCELALMRGDGSILPVRVALQRIDGIDARTVIVEDLSERQRHREIQERAERNDHFLAVLAHELRNPLGSIRNAAAILERSGLASGERAALGVIERQSEMLVRLVDDLLDVHRLNQDKMVLQRKPVLVSTAIDDAVVAAAQNLETKAQTIDVRLTEERLYVHADPVRIAQVLANLLLNASKFTGSGGHIDVRVKRSQREATRTARISVTDNGIGVAHEQLERIFEPYVQASSDASRYPEGLGLGLSVARRLVELHGGTISAQSDGPGRGSTFIVELPLCDKPADASTATDPQRVTQPARARILIADDDRDSASTLSSLLELSGHETHTAHDGNATITMADALHPDVVILDIRMPQVDGHAAARTLRQRAWANGLVLYALTGCGEQRDRDRTRDAGFDRHFVKPVSIDDLLANLADDLERRPSLAPDSSATETKPGD